MESSSSSQKRAKPSLPGNIILDLSIHSYASRVLLSTLRDKTTSETAYVRAADRLCDLLAEEGLARFAVEHHVHTPTGSKCTGLKAVDFADCCGVSVMRSGDVLCDALKRMAPNIPIGKILIQRRDDLPGCPPELHWCKFPKNIHEKCIVFVCDPMLATGGSITTTIGELVKRGVKQERIVFLNVVSCPEGLARLFKEYPHVKVVTCSVDEHLNAHMYIVPGLGDFGDRYFHTEA